MSRWVGVLVMAGLSWGCVDPVAGFDDFGSRCQDQIDKRVGSETYDGGTACDPSPTCNLDVKCTTPAVGAWDGTYVLSLSPVIAPTRPILFETKLVTEQIAGITSVRFELQPIAAYDQPGIVARQTHVGDLLLVEPGAITDGILDQEFPVLQVGGDANPVTVGSDIEAQVRLFSCPEGVDKSALGGFCADKVSEGFLCGGALGSVLKPTNFDLAGSTWTMEKVTPGEDYRWTVDPTQRPYIDCNKTEGGDVPPPP